MFIYKTAEEEARLEEERIAAEKIAEEERISAEEAAINEGTE